MKSKKTALAQEPIIDDNYALQAMSDKAQAESAILNIEGKRNIEKTEVDTKYAEELTEANAKLADAESRLEKYATTFRDQWGTSKSAKVGNGSIGFRVSRKIELLQGVTWDEVAVKCLKALPQFAFKKTVVELNKVGLKDETDPSVLEQIGCVVQETETFYAKVK